ncbi:MAG TPA: TonB family protein, partial [Longimicrobiales bacterium]|nr:TonB family protein [Longimicrobiales bacterium]
LLRSVGRQGRWAWVAAGVGSVVVPAAALGGLGPELASLVDALLSVGEGTRGAVRLPAARVVTDVAPTGVDGGWTWSFLPGLSRAAELGVLGAWIVASTALLGLYGLTWRRLRRRVEAWPLAEMDGAPVRVTRTTGPAVVGVLRPVMMVPAWVRELPADERALVLRHEREHLGAGDSRLLALFPLLAALVPWNLPLWWQIRRLRLAVELDCDARVLSGGGEPSEYGRLLVSMTRGPKGWAGSEALPLTTAALLERKSDLERRIRSMTDDGPKLRLLHAIALAALAGLAFFAACDTPAPVASDPDSGTDGAGAVAPDETGEAGADVTGGHGASTRETNRVEALPPPPAGGSATDRPAFIPRDVDPKLANVDAVREALSRLYPDEARRRGLVGRTVLWLYVGPEGRVNKVHVQESSEHPSLDRAAIQVAAEMTFEPARQDGEPLGVWIAQPVDFRRPAVESGGTVRRADEPPPAPTSVDGADDIVTLRDVSEADTGGSRYEIRADTVRFHERGADIVPADTIRLRELGDDPGEADPVRRYGTVRLRGVTSIDASDRSDEPLIIVDGVVRGDDASLSELNALDIETIEVVKGPAAREMYGERAAEGVIRITTKAADDAGG